MKMESTIIRSGTAMGKNLVRKATSVSHIAPPWHVGPTGALPVSQLCVAER